MKYYDAKQSIIQSVLQWKDSSVKWVFILPEFWFYMALHLVMTIVSIATGEDLLKLDWKASGAMQYFVTFFLTFYNSHCYFRYEALYAACMDILDGVLFFVHDLTVNLKPHEVHKHRLQATKYLLAGIYCYFMSLNADALTKREWDEMLKKGLLTRPEAETLRRYPGPDIFPVLTTWCMSVIVDALEQDCMWHPRAQRISHIHNRLDEVLLKIMRAQRKITQMRAMPVPFAYWHLMNLIFALNFLLLAVILSAYRTWLSIIPFGCTLLIFMGLREVSNALADPFGQDNVDFPLLRYMDYTFDHSVCLLQAFSHQEAYNRTKAAISNCTFFTDDQVRRKADQELLYNDKFRPHVDGTYMWDREMPLQRIAENESLIRRLSEALAKAPAIDESDENDDDANVQRLKKEEAQRQLRKLEEEVVMLRQMNAEDEEGEGADTVGALKPHDRQGQRRPSVGWAHLARRGSSATKRAFCPEDVNPETFDVARRFFRQTVEEAPSVSVVSVDSGSGIGQTPRRPLGRGGSSASGSAAGHRPRR